MISLQQLRHEDGGFVETNRVGGLIALVLLTQPDKVLEIGCHRGVSTEVFLVYCDEVVAVDPWPAQEVFDSFMARCGGYPNLKIVRDRSPEALAHFPAGSFDMVYVDGEHDRHSVERDIEAAVRIIGSGGILAGHDYGLVESVVLGRFGKPEAVFKDGSWMVPMPG